jgi:hypothetical protein
MSEEQNMAYNKALSTDIFIAQSGTEFCGCCCALRGKNGMFIVDWQIFTTDWQSVLTEFLNLYKNKLTFSRRSLSIVMQADHLSALNFIKSQGFKAIAIVESDGEEGILRQYSKSKDPTPWKGVIKDWKKIKQLIYERKVG